MKGQKPDRIPVMCQLANGHIYKHSGIGPLDYWYSPKGHVDANVAMVERYRFDGILSDACVCQDPALVKNSSQIENIDGGHIVSWNDGNKTLFPLDDDPRPLNNTLSRPAITSIEHIDLGAISTWKTEADIPSHYLTILDDIISRKGSDLSVHGEVGSAFDGLIFVLFGSAEHGLMALMDDPAKCKAILKIFCAQTIVYALAQCRRGIDALKISSPFAGAGFISRVTYEEFVLPYEREVINVVKSQFSDIPIYIHTCGRIGDRLDLLVQTGTDGIECLDPRPLGDVDLEDAVAEIGDQVFIKGNLDSVNELMNRTPREVMEIVRNRIEIGKQCRKGFVLSTACSVSPRVPPENIELLCEAAEKYGRY